jgi:hypothetical protein
MLNGVVVVYGMELCDEFRARAQRCLALAGAAPTLEAHTHWLSMAQLWLNLAQHAEDQEQHFIRDGAAALTHASAEQMRMSLSNSHAIKKPRRRAGV